LGPYPDVGLRDARDAALDARRAVRAGRDPIAEKRANVTAAKAQQAAMTFNGVLALYLGAHEETWRNPKHRQQWKNTLDTYASPVFGDWLVQAVDRHAGDQAAGAVCVNSGALAADGGIDLAGRFAYV
jgi:hypothetical protein